MTTEAGAEVVVQNPLAMSDDDFLNSPPPGTTLVVEPTEVVKEVVVDEAAKDPVVDKVATVPAVKESKEVEVVEDPSKKGLINDTVPAKVVVKKDGEDAASAKTDPAKVAAKAGDGSQKTVPAKDGSEAETVVADSSGTTVNYEQFYQQIMKPFKANGKMIELKSPEEAVQLMQMGANYTRKMQDIQPHRKMLLMLENNGLTDPDKLSFLIDIEKGNPDAIKKLLKDKGVDPMSIDTSEDSTYLVGNHKVSDDEANFRGVLDELSSNPEGKATLQAVNSTWDQASKEVLWKEPQVMQAIHEHRESGIYDRISGEVNRLRTLGQIPAETPFIHAYKAVGDKMQAEGQLADLASPGSTTAATPAAKDPIATRVAAPKTAVTNGDAASAAAATRSTPVKAGKAVNYLSMSDDDFLKQMNNRV